MGDFTIYYDNNSNLQLNFALRSDMKIQWPGGVPPKDSPECGFEKELCPPPKSKDTESESNASEILLLRVERFSLELASIKWAGSVSVNIRKDLHHKGFQSNQNEYSELSLNGHLALVPAVRFFSHFTVTTCKLSIKRTPLQNSLILTTCFKLTS